MPSMSCPRWRCASKISASAGSSRASSRSYHSTSSHALDCASTDLILVRVRRVPDVLLYGDTYRMPELRHEVPIGIPDPFLYAEKDGVKHIVIGSMEIPRLAELNLFELHPWEEFGIDELRASGLDVREIRAQIELRAVGKLGIAAAAVPETFPLWLADLLRDQDVELTVDADLFDDRRRVKTEAELAGIRRAQRAAEAAMDRARELLRGGGPLTVEQ